MTGKIEGLPDDLLTAPPDKRQTSLEAAIEQVDKVDFSTKEKRAELKRHITTLRDSVVWSVFRAQLIEAEAQIEAFIRDSSSPNELLKWSGELKMARKMREWPELTLKRIAMMDAQEEKKTNKEKTDAERK
jgi:hypothetical protein